MLNYNVNKPEVEFDAFWLGKEAAPASSEPVIGSDGLIEITDKVAGASNIYADITREKWADYVSRFIPMEDELMASYQNPEQRAERIGEARNLAVRGAESSTMQGRRQAARYGLNLRDAPAYRRRRGLAIQTAQVDAANQTRRHLNDRDQLLLAGGLSAREM